MGWYIILGTIPIGDLRPALLRPDRERRAQPVPDRDDADRARPGRCCAPSRSAAATATLTTITAATGSLIGFAQALRAGARASRARARRSPPACSSASTARRPRATRSCSRSRRSCSRALFELRKIGDEDGAGLGPTILATIARVHRRLRVDRVPAALARPATRRRSSSPTASCSASSCSRSRAPASSPERASPSTAAASRRSRVSWPSLERRRTRAPRPRAPRRPRPGRRSSRARSVRDPQLERRRALLARPGEPAAAAPLGRRGVAGRRACSAPVEPVQLGLVEQRALAPRELERLGDRGEPRVDRAGAQLRLGRAAPR